MSCRKTSGLQTAKGISGGVQFVASQTAGYIASQYDKIDPLPKTDQFGNRILSRKDFAKSLSNSLLGKVTWVLSATNTLTKINNGTVTNEDYVDFAHSTLTAVTAWAILGGLAAPWTGKTDGILALDRDSDGQITSNPEYHKNELCPVGV